MKKILISLVTVSALFTMTSCVKDYITQEVPNVTNESLIFSRADYIEANLMGCYHYFKSTSTAYATFMGGITYAALDSRGEDVINMSNPVTLQHTYMMKTSGDEQENGNTWNVAYSTINECNIFIDNMSSYKAEKVLGEAKAKQFVAEAKFVRAYTYYVLCQLYSKPYSVDPTALSVPLRLKGLKASGNNNCAFAPIQDVYAQILNDLEPENLPTNVAGTNGVVRASADAANMLKMRVLMAENKWGDAAAAGELVKGYKLVDDPASLFGQFTQDTYANTEMIFVLPMTTQDKPNTQSAVADIYGASASIAFLDTENGILSKDAYKMATDKRIANLTETKDGSVFSKKFTDVGGKLDWIPQMRYAETLLDLAECYFNMGGTANITKAKEALKTVRHRSIAAATDVLDIDAMDNTTLKQAIYNERRAELICEGFRGVDIMRRGENFVKKNSLFTITVTPADNGYVWPIPSSEYQFNNERRGY